jgi:hypothetical protein
MTFWQSLFVLLMFGGAAVIAVLSLMEKRRYPERDRPYIDDTCGK